MSLSDMAISNKLSTRPVQVRTYSRNVLTCSIAAILVLDVHRFATVLYVI